MFTLIPKEERVVEPPKEGVDREFSSEFEALLKKYQKENSKAE